MFKTITVIKLGDKQTHRLLSVEGLTEALKKPTIVDPTAGQWGRYGFSQPESFGESPVSVAADQTRLLNVQFRERILPGMVIRKAVKDRAAEIEERQGHKCGKKQIAEIKDQIVAELLPNSHIKQSDILCMISGDYLYIGTGSATKIDDILNLLRSLFEEGLDFKHIAHNLYPVKFMKEVLLEGVSEGEHFTCGDSVTLKNESKATVRIKDIDPECVNVRERIAEGFQPVELALEVEERLSFTMTDKMVLKRIKFATVLMKGVEEDSQGNAAAHFEGTVALVAGEFRELMGKLLSEIPADAEEGKPEQGVADDDEL